jgi:16S rRNA (guanine966-N2)-methyltransferase
LARKAEAPPGAVRINGGRWRGRKLPVLPHPALRPTAVRVRATLFNWLRPIVAGAECLDLFAGTGILGFEAVSLGAARAVLVESDTLLAAQIARNVALLETDAITVVPMPVARFLEQAPSPFDIVFVDPPYAAGLLDWTLARLRGGWIKADGVVYIENDTALRAPPGWRSRNSAQAGRVHYYLLQPATGPEPPNERMSRDDNYHLSRDL